MKTFRWTKPEPHHPPSPVGRSTSTDEDEEIAALASKLRLNSEEEKTLRCQLRGYHMTWWSWTSQVTLVLFLFWVAWTTPNPPDSHINHINPAFFVAVICLFQLFSQLVERFRRREFKTVMDRIAEREHTAAGKES